MAFINPNDPEVKNRLNQALAQTYLTPTAPPQPEGAGIRRIADVGIDVARAVPGVFESAAGLANLPFAPFNVAPLKGVEQAARSASEFLAQGYSPARQAEEARFQQQVQQAAPAGLWEQLKAGAGAAVENPAVGIGMLPRIAAEMVIGAKGAGAIAPRVGALGRAAIGEAGVTAGSTSAQIGESTDEEYRRLMALPAAAATGLIARGAGALVNRMAEIPGVAGTPGRFLAQGTDPESLLARKFAGEAAQGPAQGNIASRMAAGGIREGLLEELPQSFQERVMQNVALGEPWMQGAGVEAGLGAVLGGAMGAGFNIRRSTIPAPTTTETTPAVPQVGTNLPELGITAETGQPTSQITALPDRKEIGLTSIKQSAFDEALTARSKAEFDALDIKGFKDKSKEKLRATPWYESLPDTTPIAPVPEKKGNFFGIKNDLWTDITAKASKEEVDQVIDNTKGIGAKIRNDFRASEWYQSLPGKGVAPSATAEQPTVKVPPAAVLTSTAKEEPLTQVDADAIAAELDKLNAQVATIPGQAGGTVTLPQGVLAGIMRTIRSDTAKPPVAYETGTPKVDINATNQYFGQMTAVRDAAKDVIKNADALFNAQSNIVPTEARGKKPLSDVQAAREAEATAGRLVPLQQDLKNSIEQLRTAAGSDRNVEAIVAVLKARVQRPETKDVAKAKQDIKKDTLLSQSWAMYKDGAFGVPETLDVVRPRETRLSRELADTGTAQQPLIQAATEGAARRPRAPVETGLLGVMSRLQSTGTAYERVLASTIGRSLRNTTRPQPKVQFIATTEAPNYNPKTDTVSIHATASPEQQLHEALHAGLQWYVYQNPNSAEVLRLDRALTAVLDYKGDMPPKAKEVLDVLRNVAKGRSKTARLDAILELASYGTTLRDFRNVLKTLESVEAPEQKGLLSGMSNVWKRLTALVQKFLGVSNTVANDVLDATVALLEQASTAEVAAPMRGNVLKAAVASNPNEAFNPKATTFDQTEMQAAQAAYADGTAVSAKALSKFQAERAAQREAQLKERAQAPEVRRAVEAQAVREETTAVTPREAPKDNIVDSVGRSIFNALSSLVGQPDWQQGSEAWLAKKGEGISEWSMSGDKPMQRAARKVFGQVVDKYGQPGQFRGAWDRFMGSLQRINTEAFSFNELLGTDENVQNAAVDYLINRDAAALAKAVPDEAQAKFVTQLVGAMEQVYQQAQDQKLVDPKFFGRPLVDFVRFTDKKKVQAFKDQAFGPVTPTVNNKLFVFEKDVAGENVLDKKGEPVAKAEAGSKYYKLQRKDTGEPVFVREGIKNAEITRLNLTGVPNDTFAYILRGVDQTGQATFARMKTSQERRAAGEIVEPVSSMVSSFIDISRKVQAAKFTAELKNINSALADDAKWITDTAPVGVPAERVIDLKNKGDLADLSNKDLVKRVRVPGMWVKIPDDAKGQWGDLAGSYVAGPVYAAFQDFYNTDPVVQSQTFREAMAMWKKFKTVYSPVTHVNNVVGNFTLSYYHDIPMRNIKTGFKLVFGKNLTAAEQQLKNEFEASGATLGNFQEDFDQATRTAVQSWLSDGNNESDIRSLTNGLLTMQKVFATLGKTDKKLSDIYSNQDNIFRLAAYVTHLESAMERNKSAETKKTVRQMKEEAAIYARTQFVDYSITAPAIQLARQTVAPFLAWPYRMVPLMAKTMVTKPWKAANTMAVIYGLNSLAYAMVGGADEEEERKLLPEYMQTNVWGIPNLPAYIRLPFGEEGKGQFLGVGRMLPLGDMGEINNAGLPSMIAPSGPAVILLQAALNADSFMGGKQIRSETDTGAQAVGNTLAFLAKQLGPGIGYTGAKWFDNVVNDRRGPLGADANNWVETARLLGANVREVDFQEATYSQSVRAAQLQRAYGAARNRATREHLRYGDPDMDALYQDVLDISNRGSQAVRDIYGIKGE